MKGVGVDIVSVDRVERLLLRHGARFLARCFRPGELPLVADRRSRGDFAAGFAAQVAGRWAVKEACLKALGGDVRGIPYRDIEIGRAAGGAPMVTLHGRAAAALAAGGGGRVLASLSHERTAAVGMVVIDN